MYRSLHSIRLCLSLWLLIVTSASALANTSKPSELYWEDMVPKGFIAPEVTVDHMNNMSQAAPNAPVLEELNGQFVKIPGFVVPLEGTAELTTEFLLVPYFGACIHVPPPPSNQIVYVTLKTESLLIIYMMPFGSLVLYQPKAGVAILPQWVIHLKELKFSLTSKAE